MHESTVRISRTCSQVKLTVLLAVCFIGTAVAVAKDKDSVSEAAFGNSIKLPKQDYPKDYKGPFFKLSHDYPKELPKDPAPWLKVPVDFTTTTPRWVDYAPYMDTLLKYVVRGQSPELDNDTGWNLKVDGNEKTSWYHVPWMAFDSYSGREFTHGCTNERGTNLTGFIGPLPLGTSQTGDSFESWAFGVYNAVGAYSIGQTFPKSGVPTISEDNRRIPKGLPFRPGTLVAKVLFATAKPKPNP